MFLRYMNCSKSINLDNFDEVCLIEPHKKERMYSVVAIRYMPQYKLKGHITRFGNDNIKLNASGNATLVIKQFEFKDEAKAFYDKLQYHWINKISEIFEVF